MIIISSSTNIVVIDIFFNAFNIQLHDIKIFILRQIASLRSRNNSSLIIYNISNQLQQRRIVSLLNQLNNNFNDLNVSTFISFSKDNIFSENINIINIL